MSQVRRPNPAAWQVPLRLGPAHLAARPDRRRRARGLEPAAAALALAVGGALWLHQALPHPPPTTSMLLDRLVFLFVVCYVPLEVLQGLRARRFGATSPHPTGADLE